MRVTSVSESRGWIPVTKRLEPVLAAAESRSSCVRESLAGGPLRNWVSLRAKLAVRKHTVSPCDHWEKRFYGAQHGNYRHASFHEVKRYGHGHSAARLRELNVRLDYVRQAAKHKGVCC